MNWFKILKFIGLAILVSLGGLVQAQSQVKKPNILVIWGDDIGWSNVSAYNMGMMSYRRRMTVQGHECPSRIHIFVQAATYPNR